MAPSCDTICIDLFVCSFAYAFGLMFCNSWVCILAFVFDFFLYFLIFVYICGEYMVGANQIENKVFYCHKKFVKVFYFWRVFFVHCNKLFELGMVFVVIYKFLFELLAPISYVHLMGCSSSFWENFCFLHNPWILQTLYLFKIGSHQQFNTFTYLLIVILLLSDTFSACFAALVCFVPKRAKTYFHSTYCVL